MKYYLEERFILCEDANEDAAAINKESGKTSTVSPAKTANASAEKPNWAKLYAACQTKEDYTKFWTGTTGSGGELAFMNDNDEPGYYESVFGEQASAVQNLGKTFQTLLVENGFDLTKNIWLSFVNRLCKAPVNKCGIAQLSEVDLVMLIKAMEKKLIEADDLDPSKCTFKTYNLVHNPYFYVDLSTASLQWKYLELQKSYAKNNTKGLPPEQAQLAWANLYSVDGSHSQDLENLKNIAAGGKLRSLKDIEEIQNKNDGISTADSSQISKQLAKIQDKTRAKNCFIAAYNAFRTYRPEAINHLNDKLGSIPEKINSECKSLRDAEFAEVQKIFNFSKVKYNEDQMHEILTYLLKTMGVALPSKKEG